jgi:hypothetical protein
MPNLVIKVLMRVALLIGSVAVSSSLLAAANLDAVTNAVTYEAFGAVGNGVADDLPAICKAHEYANTHGLPVRTKPGATYHLGRRALTAIIATDTDWGTSRFIIDDSRGVEDYKRPLFVVRSLLKPLRLKIDRLKRGQTQLDLKPPTDCVVLVENENRKLFIREGRNQNNGSNQKEVFILHPDGSIEGGIDWDYDVVTSVKAWPIDPRPLVLRGGIFTNIANREKSTGPSSKYWERGIAISRSKTVVEGVTHRVAGETDVGSPYHGFLDVQQCAYVTLTNCVIDGRKTYEKIGVIGKSVAMGSYGYNANLVVDFRMIKCRMGNDIHDRTRWGVVGSNFMKNILLDGCVLSRMDVHQGVSGNFIIRNSMLGHAGLNAIGRGHLIVENSTLCGGHLIRFREDYGSTWDGDVLIRNCRWIPPAGKNTTHEMFGAENDGRHDFGYPCSMPRVIRIEGLFVDDSKHGANYNGITLFSDPLGVSPAKRSFAYRLTEKLEVSGLKVASGLPVRICENPAVARAISVVSKSESAGSVKGR